LFYKTVTTTKTKKTLARASAEKFPGRWQRKKGPKVSKKNTEI